MDRATDKGTKTFVGFDYDGTLESPGFPIHTKLARAMIELERRGVGVFFASGKNMPFIETLSRRIGVNPLLICAENGGHIRDVNTGKESVFGEQEVLDHFSRAIENEALPSNTHEEKISIWTKRFGDDVEIAGNIIKKLVEKSGLNLSVYTYPDGALDVVPDGIDKVNILDYIPHDAVIHYIGDSSNDLGIMQDPRVLPHTVANAKEEVKDLVAQKGGHIAQEPVGDGVAFILRNILESMEEVPASPRYISFGDTKFFANAFHLTAGLAWT
jgi:hydroxymethylpyrimidine pyrophosphatase-like HAD family hydrolase